MPYGVLGVPGVATGIADLAGAGIGTVSSKHAANLQAEATDKALAFEKEREATRKAEYDRQQVQAQRQWQVYQQQMSPYRNIAAQYLARYGYKPALWTLGDYANPNGGPSGPQGGQGVGLAPNMSIGMGAPRPGGGPPPMPPDQTLAGYAAPPRRPVGAY